MKRLIAVLLTLVRAIAVSAQPDPADLFRVDIPVYRGEELFLSRLGLDEAFVPDNGVPPGGGGSDGSAPKVISLLPERDMPSAETEAVLSGAPDGGINPGSAVKRPLGIVFSGGAARAFAHIGVLKRLEEAGIIPDFIVANSMGSVVALLYAAGASPALIERMITEYPTDSLFRPGIPLNGGVLDTSRFTSMLYSVMGELDLADLEIPVAIIAEDLETRRQVIFMEGDFYPVLEASISMPFSFPPVRYEGMTLIDGGVTNLVPVDAAARYTDRIIVSTALYNLENEYRNPVTIINRAFDIGKTRKGVSQLKETDNVLIRCDVESYSYMDFQKMGEIIEKGYTSADAVADQLSAAGLDHGTLWDSEKLDALYTKRKQLDDSYVKATDEYTKTGIVNQKELSLRTYAGFNMYSGTRDDYYLDNTDYVFLGQSAEAGRFQASVREYYAPCEGYGLDGRIDFAVSDLLISGNRAMNRWDGNEHELLLLYNRIDLNLFRGMDKGIVPFAARESIVYGMPEIDSDKSLVRAGVSVFSGSFLASPYFFSENSGTDGAGFENEISARLAGNFFFDQKTVYRKAFENGTEIMFYRNDGLRGYDRQGASEEVIVTNNSIVFRADTSLSFGEILLVKNLAASLFCDYYRTAGKGISAGSALDLDFSFIGLTSLHFAAYAGYDYHHERLFASLSVGNGN